MNIAEVRTILERNFTAIGWRLDSFEVQKGPWSDYDHIRGGLTCPCGGKEYFHALIENVLEEPQQERWCDVLLATVASKHHLEQDVAEGKLPAFAIEKHIYGGTLL